MEQKKKFNVRTLTECAVMLALAVVLSFIKVWEMPMGGSVTLVSMLPIVMVSIKHGNKAGLAVGFLFSLIQLVQGIASGNVFLLRDGGNSRACSCVRLHCTVYRSRIRRCFQKA